MFIRSTSQRNCDIIFHNSAKWLYPDLRASHTVQNMTFGFDMAYCTQHTMSYQIKELHCGQVPQCTLLLGL